MEARVNDRCPGTDEQKASQEASNITEICFKKLFAVMHGLWGSRHIIMKGDIKQYVL